MSDSNPLLNNVSVQGAAKSIEGLMDSKGVIKKPQAEATPVEPKEEVEAKVLEPDTFRGGECQAGQG